MRPLQIHLLSAALLLSSTYGLLVSAGPAAGPTIYVAQDGNDSWTGGLARPNAAHTDGPLATLIGARDRLRKLRSGQPAGGAVVEIEDGFYEMSEPFTLSPDDGADGDSAVIYRAASGAHPIFSGGTRLTGWKTNPDGTWSTTVPGVAEGKWNFTDLYVNGERAVPAQSPDPGNYYAIPKSLDYTVEPYKSEAVDVDFRSFVVNAADIQPYLALTDDEKSRVTVETFHAWQTTVNYIDTVTKNSDGTYVVKLKGEGYNKPYYDRAKFEDKDGDTEDLGSPVMARRYILHNIKGGITSPGEWYLDHSSGVLTYKPRSGESIGSVLAVAPRLDQLMVISGSASQKVQNVHFEGLAFRHARYILGPEGSVSRGSSKLPASILVNRAANIVFDNIELAHTGANGLWCDRNIDHCVIQNSHVFDIGGTGIRLGQVDSEPDQTNNIKNANGNPDPADHNVVDNNVIAGMGKTYKNAHGVLVGFSGFNQITHNDMSDMYRDAIMMGASITPFASRTHDNLIAYNNLHNIGKGVLSDFGSIHFFGPQPNTTFDHNRVYDIKRFADGYPGFGIYADNLTSFVTFTNNVIYGCEEDLMLNFTRQLVFNNNIFINSGPNQYTFSAIGKGRTAIRVSNKRMNKAWAGRGGFQGDLAYLNRAPGFSFTNNIVVNSGDDYLLSPSFQWDRELCSNKAHVSDKYCLETKNTVDKNVYFRTDGPGVFPGLHQATRNSLSGWKAMGYDLGSIEANPQFVDAAANNYQLSSNSPAFGLGFKQIDMSQIGPTSESQRSLAKETAFKERN